jgi:hypothetical protein
MFRNFIARLLTVTAVVLVATGCNKEKDTIAIVKIVDEEGRPVEGAYVKLFANLAYPIGDPTRLTREESTDNKGMARFDYTQQFKQGQAGFAVLDIESYKDSSAGFGIIKILEEEETEETVVIEYAY